MAANGNEMMCEYCWRPANYKASPEEGNHNGGCPLGKGTLDPQALAEWKEGYHRGFMEEDALPHQWNSKSFCLGHRAGKEEIDRQVDIAAQRCVWGDEY